MDFIDKIKFPILRPEKPENPSGDPPEGIDGAKPIGTGFSGVKRALLSKAADVMLKGSKKAADLVVSRYRPSLMFDGILNPQDIRQLIDDRAKHTNISVVQLILLATNCYETLPIARELRAEILASDASGVSYGEADPPPDESAEEDQLPQSALEQSLSYVDALLDALDAVVAEDTERVLASVQQLLSEDESFNHPLLARFVLTHMLNTSGDRELVLLWCRKALFYWPLDAELLSIAEDYGDPVFKNIAAQLNALNDN